jgi:CBS domain-containing protein
MKTAGKQTVKFYASTLYDIVRERMPLTFNPKTTVPEIIKRMHEHRCSAGAIIDPSGAFIGFTTKREIIRRIFGRFEKKHFNKLESLHEHKAISKMTAWDVMICNPDTLYIDDTVEDALDVITYFGYSHMPVMGDNRRLVGIASAKELLRHVEAKANELKRHNEKFLPPHMIRQEIQGLNIQPFETY